MFNRATARVKPRVLSSSIKGLMLEAVCQQVESELAADVALRFVACQCSMRNEKPKTERADLL